MEPSLTPRPRPTFLCDVMLGRLARWLRILGHDTAYAPAAEDRELLGKALREDRVLLTRDSGLLGRRRAPAVIGVESERIEEQLSQLHGLMGILDHPSLFTRCPRCNSPLRPCTAAEAEALFPPYVRRTSPRLSLCPRCRRGYWPGSHRLGILERVKAAAASPPPP